MSKFVTVDVDHDKKLIEVVLRVDFYIPDKSTGLKDFREGKIPDIVKGVEAKWSKDQKYKCYDFRLRLDWRFVDGATADAARKKVRADALDVLVWEGSEGGYGQTASKGPDQDRATSDKPEDIIEPVRGTDDLPSFWPLSVDLMAHEVGHAIGLEDGYVQTSFWEFWESEARTPLKGHPADIMQSSANDVLPSTVQRVVRRHLGKQVDETLKCPMTLKTGPAKFELILASLDNIRLIARTKRYDPPTDDPAAKPDPTKFTGTFEAAGEYLTKFPQLPWAASGQAKKPVTFTVDFGKKPLVLEIDLEFWVLVVELGWDPKTNLPYPNGPFQIQAGGATLDSSMMFPGPALMPVFSHEDAGTP